MNKMIASAALFGVFLMASCEKKPPAATNTSEYREGKSGATTRSIEDSKTDDPTPYPDADQKKE